MIYIFDDVEVKITGRTATKTKNKRQSRRNQSDSQEQTTKIIHEITPIDKTVGSWRKWVDLKTLFVVEGE